MIRATGSIEFDSVESLVMRRAVIAFVRRRNICVSRDELAAMICDFVGAWLYHAVENNKPMSVIVGPNSFTEDGDCLVNESAVRAGFAARAEWVATSEPEAAEYLPAQVERYEVGKCPDLCPDDHRDFEG